MDEDSPESGPPNRPLLHRADPGGADDIDQDVGDEPVHWSALARQLAGEGSADDEAVVRAWTESHPTDAAAVAALDQSLDGLAFAPAADLDVEAALRRVRARRAAEMPTPIPAPAVPDPNVVPIHRARPAATPVRRWRTPLRAAAAIAVLVGGAAVWRAVRGDAGARTFATAVGQRDSLDLPDGSRIILAPGSTLDVAAGYGAERREVHLRGEALFTVRHDAAHPFRVLTRVAAVNDVGTAFVVRESDDGAVTVSVSEGAVRLHATDAAASSTAQPPADSGVVLHAGDRGVVAAGGRAEARRGTATTEDAAWTRGSLVFRDATVPEVVAELRRWYGLELRLADPSLADRHLTATFHGEPADQVLRVVGLALGTVMERHSDTVMVRAAPGAAPMR